MIRKVIQIDEEKCNGCGLCAAACQEGAIGMIDGKAKLLRDDYCDGLGDCLPACPAGAIHFETREAAAFDEAAVQKNQVKQQPKTLACGCPGTQAKTIERQPAADCATVQDGQPLVRTETDSQLQQWPVQIKLVPSRAPYFANANLLIAADCTAYAFANFHQRFIRNHITLIGCPKLDEGNYTSKLSEIIKQNEIKSVTIVRMEVPCCSGLEQAAKIALQSSGKFIPWQVITISTDGRILD
ncbi:MAG: 4Fe-4S binding protein [Negativicutes bacterium]|nr:4Fe-4S binding protein [Negativicutes bacterium]